jgi:DNA-directed RNA polymerase specialized sigma24 family protein
MKSTVVKNRYKTSKKENNSSRLISFEYREALKALSSDEQNLIILSESYGYSMPELSSMMSMSEEKLRKKIQRARLNLLKRMS